MKNIYIKPGTTLKEAVRALKRAGGKTVVFVVERHAQLFRDPKHLKRLAAAVKKSRKNVAVATVSRSIRSLARAAGFDVITGSGTARDRQPLITDVEPAPDKHPGRQLKRAIIGILPKKTRSRFPRKALVLGILGVLLVLGALVLVLPEATIAVVIRSEPVTRDMEIQVDTKVSKPDAGFLKIPGRREEKEVSVSREFTPTGSRNTGKRASGFVQLYNLTTNTLVLRAETTTIRVGEREYVMLQNASGIRPTAFIGQGEERRVDSSSLVPPVPVAAVEAGEGYNLSAGTRVEIHNEAFGFQPEVLYGEVAEDIAGGTTELIRIVTEADIAESYRVLTEEAFSEYQQVPSNAVRTEVLEQSSSHEPGDETEQFRSSMRIRLNALLFSREDALQVVRERVRRLLPENKAVSESDEHVLETSFFMVDLENGTGALNTHYEARVIYQLENEDIIDRVRGKNPEEVKEILLSRPEVKSVEVRLQPFWVTKVPKLQNRINVQKTLDIEF